MCMPSLISQLFQIVLSYYMIIIASNDLSNVVLLNVLCCQFPKPWVDLYYPDYLKSCSGWLIIHAEYKLAFKICLAWVVAFAPNLAHNFSLSIILFSSCTLLDKAVNSCHVHLFHHGFPLWLPWVLSSYVHGALSKISRVYLYSHTSLCRHPLNQTDRLN